MRNLTILLSDKLQKCWLCRRTFMANSSLVAIGDRVSHPGPTPLNSGWRTISGTRTTVSEPRARRLYNQWRFVDCKSDTNIVANKN
jgi:hypothetical protein